MTEELDAASHEWVRWLSSADTQVLLLYLCQSIDTPTTTLDILRFMTYGWRHNALRALTAEDWTAEIDGYLGVRVDARAYLLSHGELHEGCDACGGLPLETGGRDLQDGSETGGA